MIYDPIIITILMVASPLSLLPQIKKATKTTKGLSLISYVIQTVLQAYYIGYYVKIGSTPLLINGIVGFSLLSIITGLILFKKDSV